MKRLAYLMGTFPALTETFVLGEIEALVDAGVRVDLYSLRRPRTAHDRSQGEDLAAATRYGLPLGGRAVWAANLRVLTTAPRRYLGALAAVAGRTALNPVHCLKSLGLFPVAVAFAEAHGAGRRRARACALGELSRHRGLRGGAHPRHPLQRHGARLRRHPHPVADAGEDPEGAASS